jgi:hypothetical protein
MEGGEYETCLRSYMFNMPQAITDKVSIMMDNALINYVGKKSLNSGESEDVTGSAEGSHHSHGNVGAFPPDVDVAPSRESTHRKNEADTITYPNAHAISDDDINSSSSAVQCRKGSKHSTDDYHQGSTSETPPPSFDCCDDEGDDSSGSENSHIIRWMA